MLDIVLAIPLVVLSWLCGLPIFFISGRSVAGRLGLSFIIGSAIATFSVFLSYVLIFKQFSLLQVSLTLLIVVTLEAAYVFGWQKQKLRPFLSEILTFFRNILSVLVKREPKSFLITILIVLAAFSLISNLFWPVSDWDALAHYDYRAKVIVDMGTLSENFPPVYFYQYPPYTSLLHSFTYFSGSTSAKIWYSLLYCCFLISFYALIRRSSSQTVGLLATVLLASSSLIFNHSMMAYTNLPYTIFISLGILELLVWFQSKQMSYLLMGTLLIAFSSWIRLAEPFWVIGIILLLISMWKYKDKFFIQLLSIILIYLMRLPWSFYIDFYQLIPSVTTQLTLPESPLTYFSSINNLLEVSIFFIKNVATPYFLYFVLMTISLIFSIIYKNYYSVFSHIIAFGLLLALFTGLLAFSYMFNGWKDIPDSAIRLSMILIPIALFAIFDGLKLAVSHPQN